MTHEVQGIFEMADIDRVIGAFREMSNFAIAGMIFGAVVTFLYMIYLTMYLINDWKKDVNKLAVYNELLDADMVKNPHFTSEKVREAVDSMVLHSKAKHEDSWLNSFFNSTRGGLTVFINILGIAGILFLVATSLLFGYYCFKDTKFFLPETVSTL
ncbi:hypothetical protein NEFER03_1727 [Nematocida sp. LUAm3]|nr:hypothetical protein NEFER03_1727 [Nematocida sp. LUAm3]KAI5175717.1 hypothetical protein NEFER02_1604 [Nematocida sp. LUAm2]KAI5178623.1 hypothetical protein NEFER01_1759 [Nematocida sp. LUAm1]